MGSLMNPKMWETSNLMVAKVNLLRHAQLHWWTEKAAAADDDGCGLAMLDSRQSVMIFDAVDGQLLQWMMIVDYRWWIWGIQWCDSMRLMSLSWRLGVLDDMMLRRLLCWDIIWWWTKITAAAIDDDWWWIWGIRWWDLMWSMFTYYRLVGGSRLSMIWCSVGFDEIFFDRQTPSCWSYWTILPTA